MSGGRWVSIAIALLLSPVWGLGLAAEAQAASEGGKAIAFTFDKLPFMEPLGYWTPREVSHLVLRTLQAEGIRAVGFVIEEKLEERPETLVILQDWVEFGQGVGNNTFGYLDLNEVEYRDFLTHVAEGQKHLRRVTRTVKMPRYFRYPMLHEGNTPAKKVDVAKRLKRADFINVPATVILFDYEFNHVYAEASGDSARGQRLEQLFLRLLNDSLSYAESQSEAVFGRQIPQILRLHLGVATANFLGSVIRSLKERGYRFVTVDEALADPAYSTEETYVGPLGLSFIDRVAASRGLPYREDQGEIRRSEIARELESSGE